MTKREATARQTLWLSWLDMPWDQVRVRLVHEMTKADMTQTDLTYELWRSGYRVSQSSVSKWLDGRTSKVPLEALQALVAVFARVEIGEWAKGAQLSLDGLGTPTAPPDGQGESHLAYAS